MMKTKYSISAVIPIYNEEAYIKDLIAALHQALSGLCRDYEIVAVDDASTDDTPRLLEDLSRRDERLVLVSNRENLGLGGALRAGFFRASKDIVFYTDADMPCDLANLEQALSLIDPGGADIVSAYRNNRMVEGLRRFIYSRGYNMLIGLLFGVRLKDINFSFKLFKTDKLKRLTLFSRGSFIDSEIIIRAKDAGYRIEQIPLRYLLRSKGNSKLDNFSNIRTIILEIISFIKERRRQR